MTQNKKVRRNASLRRTLAGALIIAGLYNYPISTGTDFVSFEDDTIFKNNSKYFSEYIKNGLEYSRKNNPRCSFYPARDESGNPVLWDASSFPLKCAINKGSFEKYGLRGKYEKLQDLLKKSLNIWENQIGIDIKYNSKNDTLPEEKLNNLLEEGKLHFVFTFKDDPGNSKYAKAFFPDKDLEKSRRHIRLYTRLFGGEEIDSIQIIGIINHEIGHVLGLHHPIKEACTKNPRISNDCKTFMDSPCHKIKPSEFIIREEDKKIIQELYQDIINTQKTIL